jgi:GT2 family glycosyltransferase
MSSLSNLPYGKILDYWFEKLSGNKKRTKFLLTKCVEFSAFKSKNKKDKPIANIEFVKFPDAVANNILENPVVSIVIPAFVKTEKDKQDIFNLFNSIQKQTRKPDYVIVIDDYSPADFICPNNVIYHKLPQNSGPANARNIGKQVALSNNSDIIAFTDTDCIPSENWVETICKSLKKMKLINILSGNTISYDKNWFGTYHNLNGTLNGRTFINSEKLLYGTTANLAITREVATKVDFSENFLLAAGEDIEFCFKANQQGFAIKHIQKMIVYHNYGYTRNFWKNIQKFRNQFQKYGKGEITLLNEIPNYYVYFDKTEEIPANKIK